MLGAFVKQMNEFSDFARETGPIKVPIDTQESQMPAEQLAHPE
jgi:hypothetical protein